MKDQLTNIESLLSTRANDKSTKECQMLHRLLMQFFADQPVGYHTAAYSDGRIQTGIPIDHLYHTLKPKSWDSFGEDSRWQEAVETFVAAFNHFAHLWSKKRQEFLLKEMAKSLISHVNAIETVTQ